MKMEVMLLPGAKLPAYESEGASGLDLRAAHNALVYPRGRTTIRTGIKVAIPKGFEGQVRPRSGLAAKHGITVLNTPGTIDCDYRGEICVILYNSTTLLFNVEEGDRIAQLVIAPVVQAWIVQVSELDGTKRGEGGLGSTGV